MITMACFEYASFGKKPDLCLSVPCTKEKKKPKRELIVAIVATSMVVLVLLLLIFCALAIYKRKRRGMSFFCVKFLEESK